MRSLSVSLLAAVSALAQAPTAESILDRFVEVTGGKAAYERVKGETMTGTMEMKAQGVKGKTVSYRGPNLKSYMAMEIEGAGKIEQGVVDGVAWEKSAMNGPRIKTGEERAFQIREALIARDAHWREAYEKAELQGEEACGDATCYKLLLAPKGGGRPETHFFDKATGLRAKTTTVLSTQMGDLPVEMLFSEYKEFSGLKVPTKTVNKMAGQEFQLLVNSVDIGPVPVEKFALPPDVKALAVKSGASKK